MKRAILSAIVGPLLSSAQLLAGPPLRPSPAPAPKPKLVVLIAVDQLRCDYLYRFADGFEGGLRRLLAEGAVFSDAQLEHYPTVTAVGHATMLSGATPALSGIIGNDWYDRETGGSVTSVSDPATTRVGAPGGGSSPRRLLVSTVGDELKMAGRGGPRVVGVSLKDRSAILPAGRMADAAYWFDVETGRFVSSTYYMDELPGWAKAFNDRRPADAYAGAQWRALAPPNAAPGLVIRALPAVTGHDLYQAVYGSPFGNELLEAFAEAALEAERLGQRDATDVLSVSFSSNDAVGHAAGPDSAAVRDITVRADRVIQRLLDAIDRKVGRDRALVILTADHGVAPVPETMAERRMPGGRMASSDLFGAIEAALALAYGPGKWVVGTAGAAPYLNRELIRERKLDEAEVERTAARAASSVPHVLRVYTREQLLLGQVPRDPQSERVLRSFHPQRSGDLEILLDPYWIRGDTGTTHGTPYSYDSHVPLIFLGPWVRPGRYHGHVALNDVAPTLAVLLEIETPSGSAGRVLSEILEREPPGRPPR